MFASESRIAVRSAARSERAFASLSDFCLSFVDVVGLVLCGVPVPSGDHVGDDGFGFCFSAVVDLVVLFSFGVSTSGDCLIVFKSEKILLMSVGVSGFPDGVGAGFVALGVDVLEQSAGANLFLFGSGFV